MDVREIGESKLNETVQLTLFDSRKDTLLKDQRCEREQVDNGKTRLRENVSFQVSIRWEFMEHTPFIPS